MLRLLIVPGLAFALFDSSELAYGKDDKSLMNIADVDCADLSDGSDGIHCWCSLSIHPVSPGAQPVSVMIPKREFGENNYRKTLSCKGIQTIMKERARLGTRKVEDCPERERKKLNEKIKIEFEKEFSAASELEGLEMKFLQLDKNGDSKLTKNEMKPIFDLRRKPYFSGKRTRMCLRSIISRCDDVKSHLDKRLGLAEWNTCFSGLLISRNKIYDILIPEMKETGSDKRSLTDNELPTASTSIFNGQPTGRTVQSSHKPRANNCREEKRYIQDCHRPVTRKTRSSLPLKYSNTLPVTTSSSSSNNCAPIPSCSMSDSRKWKRIQCDAVSSLCWCVNPLTGDYDYNFRVKSSNKNSRAKLKCRDDVVPGCSSNFISNLSQRLVELMHEYLDAHPDDQSKLIDENQHLLGDGNNAGALSAAWFFSQYDVESRRRNGITKKDLIWSRKEQAEVRKKLLQVMEGLESSRCIMKLLPFCDQLGDKNAKGDRKIQKEEFVQCLDPSKILTKQQEKSNYQQYFKRLQEKKT